MTARDTGGERGAVVRHAQRASGQVAALARMVAAGHPFREVTQQVLAARGSLDSLLVRLMELELGDCLPSRAVRDEVDSLLRTAIGRAQTSRGATRTPRRGLTATTAQLSEERTA